jgi:hypothetical protein
MRCTTFTQLPLVFCAGRSENSWAAAGLMLSTVPPQCVSGLGPHCQKGTPIAVFQLI